MSIFRSKSGILLSTLAGAALGYFILHPYTQVVYGLYGQGEGAVDLFDFRAMAREALSAFTARHIHMGLPFALLGAAAGLFLGLWLDSRRHRMDAELNACAGDTLKTLMVTLSHYLLNAATVIGGFAWRIQKENPDKEALKHAIVIRKEAEYIEAIVKSLIELQTVEPESYTRNSETKIIDLTEELNRRLKERSAETPGERPAEERETL